MARKPPTGSTGIWRPERKKTMRQINSGILPRRTTSVVGTFVLFTLVILVVATAGILPALLPWWLVVALVIVPVFAVVAWLTPDIAVIGILAALFGVLPDILLPTLPIGGGELKPEDLGIPALLVLLLVKHAGSLRPRLQPMRHYWIPLGLFILVAATSALIALAYKFSPAKDIFNEARPYVTWLLLPVLCLAIETDRQMKRFQLLLMGLALVLAVGVMFQSFTGIAIFGRGQELRQLWSLDGGVADVLRSTTPGMFLMTGALIYLFAAYAKEQIRQPVVVALLSALLIGGVLVGFGRGLWFSLFVGVGMLAFFSRKAAYARLAITCTVGAALVIATLLLAKPEYVYAVSDRLLSVGEEIERGSSFGRRTEENHYALVRIYESPILGVGLGGRYKPDSIESRSWPDQVRYVHNAYMRVAVKTGIPGLLTAVFLVFVLLRRGWTGARQGTQNPAISFAAYWVILTTTVLTAITQPNFVAPNGVASIALAIFLIERLRVGGRVDAFKPNERHNARQVRIAK